MPAVSACPGIVQGEKHERGKTTPPHAGEGRAVEGVFGEKRNRARGTAEGGRTPSHTAELCGLCPRDGGRPAPRFATVRPSAG